MKQRLLSLDAIKGIAILLVLMDHTYVYGDLPAGESAYSYLAEFFHAVHMPLFVIVAGFFSQKVLTSFNDWGGYLQDKVIRLVVPPLLWWCVWTLWHYGEIFLGAFYTAHYWFTFHLFVYFLVFAVQNAVITALVQYIPKRIQTLAEVSAHLLAMLLIHYTLSFVIPEYFPAVFRHANVLQVRMACLYPYFVFGYLLGRYALLDKLRTPLAGALSFLGIVVAMGSIRYENLSTLYLTYGLWHVNRLLGISTFIFLVYIMSPLTEQGGRASRLLVFLGQWSLPIYFTHWFFLPHTEGMRSLLNRVVPDARLSLEIMIYVGGTLMTLFPTLIAIYCIRQNKYLDFFLYGEKYRLFKRKAG